MGEEEEEVEPSGTQRPRQRYMRPHREINAEVAGFVTRRRVPSYKNFDQGQQEIYDNVSACIGEGREYSQRREAWEGSHGSTMQEYWAAQEAQRERMNKFMEEQERFQAMQRSHMEQLAKMQEDEAARRRAWEEAEAARRQEEEQLNRRRWSALSKTEAPERVMDQPGELGAENGGFTKESPSPTGSRPSATPSRQARRHMLPVSRCLGRRSRRQNQGPSPTG
ncbi:uncharacterized protein LOC110931168 [Helianthus annuus]|uniref:uncharacterized protein LOC110931168 n=1 Tax=Helianthus annuus TaxID=4232 RepID=UPI000B9079D7|nr:uncharacterized protein LOC110931168 [Helianthus annuus]